MKILLNDVILLISTLQAAFHFLCLCFWSFYIIFFPSVYLLCYSISDVCVTSFLVPCLSKRDEVGKLENILTPAFCFCFNCNRFVSQRLHKDKKDELNICFSLHYHFVAGSLTDKTRTRRSKPERMQLEQKSKARVMFSNFPVSSLLKRHAANI